MFTLKEIKENLALSYIASAAANVSNATPDIVYDYMQSSLEKSKATSGVFDIAWGPAVLKHVDSDEANDHVLYVVKKGSNDYRLVIRGTITLYNAIDEDYDISQTSWSQYDPTSPSTAKITTGTKRALDIIIPGVSNNTPGEGKTLYEFIDSITNNGNLINLTVTGHSLGGFLASALALLLKSRYIGLNVQNLNVHCCTFAAPAFGNTVFADYFDSFFDSVNNASNCLRLYNENDIVPKAWVRDTTRQINSIYSPKWQPNAAIVALIEVNLIRMDLYSDVDQFKQISPSESFTYALDDNASDWSAQAGIQHLNAYPANYSMSWFDVSSKNDTTEGDIIVIRGSGE